MKFLILSEMKLKKLWSKNRWTMLAKIFVVNLLSSCIYLSYQKNIILPSKSNHQWVNIKFSENIEEEITKFYVVNMLLKISSTKTKSKSAINQTSVKMDVNEKKMVVFLIVVGILTRHTNFVSTMISINLMIYQIQFWCNFLSKIKM